MGPRANKSALTNGLPNRIDVQRQDGTRENAIVRGQMLRFPILETANGEEHEVSAATLRQCFENNRPVRI